MNNVVLEDREHGGLVCSCGAECRPGETKRFRRRHPALCDKRMANREFTKRLAARTKSADYDAVARTDDPDLLREL